MPIYEELVKTPDGLAFAREVFARGRPGYHPITTASVEALLARADAAVAPAPTPAPAPATAEAPAQPQPEQAPQQ